MSKGVLKYLRIFTHADGSRVSVAIIRVCKHCCVWLSLSVRIIKSKRLKLKSQIWHTDTSPISVNIRSKGQRSRPQVTKRQWPAWVIHSIECPASCYFSVWHDTRSDDKMFFFVMSRMDQSHILHIALYGSVRDPRNEGRRMKRWHDIIRTDCQGWVTRFQR